MKKWIFAPKTFNQLIETHDERIVKEMHNRIVRVVLAHTKGKTYTEKRWDLNGYIIDLFEKLGQKITRTTPDKWRRRILEGAEVFANDATKIELDANILQQATNSLLSLTHE